ncbi:MAG: aldehyde dehydrogenase family protein [Pseudomonadota bacterium]
MDHKPASIDWTHALDALGVDADPDAPSRPAPVDDTLLVSPAATLTANDAAAASDWARRSRAERHRALDRFAALLTAHTRSLAHAHCLETGYPVTQCQRSIAAGAAHFAEVSQRLYWPAETAATTWRARGDVRLAGRPGDGLADALAQLASALYVGCSVRWQPQAPWTLLARILVSLWQRAQADDTGASASLRLDADATAEADISGSHRVWVAPSAPVEHTVTQLAEAVCWQNGAGACSVHDVVVDHALHWEITHRLTDALAQCNGGDPREPTCAWPDHVPRPRVHGDTADSAAPGHGAVTVRATDTVPTLDSAVRCLSVFSIDQRELHHIKQHAGLAERICINTVPSSALELDAQAWHRWLKPQRHTEHMEPPC